MTANPSAAVRQAAAEHGVRDALTALNPGGLRSFEYTRMRAVDANRVAELATVSQRPHEAGAAYVTTPTPVAAGRYDVQVWFDDLQRREADIVVMAGPRAPLAHVSGEVQNPTRMVVDLPVMVRSFSVRVADKTAGANVTAVRIVPLQPFDQQRRAVVRVQDIESIGGREGALIIYSDEHAYPEGGAFWTRATKTAKIWIAAAGAARATLTISTGPRSGDVRVKSPDGTKVVRVPEGRPQQVTFPAPSGLFPLEVQSTVMFSPVDSDPQSRDIRPLGCRVVVSLE
jgi:hypothetical protein